MLPETIEYFPTSSIYRYRHVYVKLLSLLLCTFSFEIILYSSRIYSACWGLFIHTECSICVRLTFNIQIDKQNTLDSRVIIIILNKIHWPRNKKGNIAIQNWTHKILLKKTEYYSYSDQKPVNRGEIIRHVYVYVWWYEKVDFRFKCGFNSLGCALLGFFLFFFHSWFKIILSAFHSIVDSNGSNPNAVILVYTFLDDVQTLTVSILLF